MSRIAATKEIAENRFRIAIQINVLAMLKESLESQDSESPDFPFRSPIQCLAEIPLLRGGGLSHLHLACSPRGKRSEKGEGVSHPIGHVETPKTP